MFVAPPDSVDSPPDLSKERPLQQKDMVLGNSRTTEDGNGRNQTL